MTKSKLPENMTAVPLKCDVCGKHKPLYILLFKYKTKKDSEDYACGVTEIELGYDNRRYCKRCLDKKVFET